MYYRGGGTNQCELLMLTSYSSYRYRKTILNWRTTLL